VSQCALVKRVRMFELGVVWWASLKPHAPPSACHTSAHGVNLALYSTHLTTVLLLLLLLYACLRFRRC
jgi:1,4-dihydroxy-2-naphthoate octaprenyltransferase